MTSFATKYRPRNLDEVIGHESVVTKLRGIINSQRYPNAILLTGPSSAGKTTIARAFAASLSGIETVEGNPDFYEVNCADTRTIDDMRAIVSSSKLRPMKLKMRVILLDEAQQILSLPASTQTLLKPIEQPPKSTLWILSSMEPEKFSTTSGGRALANRCLQFSLEKPSAEELRKQAIRIIKGEGLSFIGKEALSKLVESCNQEMRTLANLIQQATLYYEGLEEQPKKLSEEDVDSVLASSQLADEVGVVRFLTALYAGNLSSALKIIPDVADVFQFINRCIYFNKIVLLDLALKGTRHPKIWMNKHTHALKSNLGKIDVKRPAQTLARVQAELFQTKAQMMTAVDLELLITLAYRVTAVKGE